MKKIAVFEVEFEEKDMISKDDLMLFYNNDLLKFMQILFKDEGFGIFDKEIKLVNILNESEVNWLWKN